MIGFFGGSFDPVHFGHLKSAVILKDKLNLTDLFLMPCADPVHKNGLSFSKDQRLEMLQLAVQEFSALSIDLREINRLSASYTIDSLIEIKKAYADTPVCLIVGMDSFINLHTWKNWQDFYHYAHLVVITRPDYHPEDNLTQSFTQTNKVADLHEQLSGLLYFANTGLLNISSSEIRGKIAQQQNLSGLLPDTIIHYINYS
jgi:nicotinate-nucleotide adenylyltransferase